MHTHTAQDGRDLVDLQIFFLGGSHIDNTMMLPEITTMVRWEAQVLKGFFLPLAEGMHVTVGAMYV